MYLQWSSKLQRIIYGRCECMWFRTYKVYFMFLLYEIAFNITVLYICIFAWFGAHNYNDRKNNCMVICYFCYTLFKMKIERNPISFEIFFQIECIIKQNITFYSK